MNSIYKMPSDIKRKIFRKAPIITISENSGRKYGDFSEYDITSRGYKNIIVYIQKGLSNYSVLIKNIIKPILQTQMNSGIQFSLIPLTFGIDEEPFYNGKYFSFKYRQDISKISKIISELSGDKQSNIPAIIPRLFPQVSIKNLYSGKTGIKKKNDLLIVIGRKDEFYFDESIEVDVNRFRKQIFSVEIDEDNIG